MKDALVTTVGFLVAIWLAGIPFFVWSVSVTRRTLGEPYGWPWLLPLWPFMVAAEMLDKWRLRRRLARMKAEVWRR